MIRFLVPTILTFAAMTAAAQADDLYYIDGYRNNCRLAVGGEGIIAIAPGRLSITESHYERLTDRQAVAGGWQRATWALHGRGRGLRPRADRSAHHKGPDRRAL